MMSNKAFIIVSLFLALSSCREIMTKDTDWLLSTSDYKIADVFGDARYCFYKPRNDPNKELNNIDSSDLPKAGDRIRYQEPGKNARFLLVGVDELIWEDSREIVDFSDINTNYISLDNRKYSNCHSSLYKKIRRIDNKTYAIRVEFEDIKLFWRADYEENLDKKLKNDKNGDKLNINVLEFIMGIEKNKLSNNNNLGIALRFYKNIDLAEMSFIDWKSGTDFGRKVFLNISDSYNQRGRRTLLFSAINCLAFSSIKEYKISTNIIVDGKGHPISHETCRVSKSDIPDIAADLAEITAGKTEEARNKRFELAYPAGFQMRFLSEGPPEPKIPGVPFSQAFVPDLADTLIEKSE